MLLGMRRRSELASFIFDAIPVMLRGMPAPVPLLSDACVPHTHRRIMLDFGVVNREVSFGGGFFSLVTEKRRIRRVYESVCTLHGVRVGTGVGKSTYERARERDDERCEDATHIVYRWVCIDNVYVHRVPPCLERRPSRRAHVVRIEPVELNPCGDQRIQPIREEKQVFVF